MYSSNCRRIGFYACVMLSIVFFALFWGCRKSSPGQDKIRIAGIIFQEDQFFRLVEYGMRAAAEKHDVELLLGSSSNSLDKEISLIDTYTAAGVDAIVISPISVKASVPALKRAYDKGIKLVTYNGFIEADFCDYVIESDPTQLGSSTGQEVCRYVNKNMDGKARIAMIEFISQSLEFGKMRPDGFRGEIKKLPGIEIVTEQDAWLAEMATSVVTDILTAHPDIDIIWAANEGGTVGAVTAVKNSGKTGKVVVFGTDMSGQIADFMLAKDNILQVVTGQKPYEIGFKAIEAAVRVVHGEQIAKKHEYLPGTLYTRNKPDHIREYQKTLKELTD